jgi:uncharacterized Zn-binding protein involved in type VI secretion
MGMPAAKQGDQIVGNDVHVVLQTPTPIALTLPFVGALDADLSPDVRVMGSFAATVGSQATNAPVHVPIGGPFQRPPSNLGRVAVGSPTVRINGRPAARAGDAAVTCNDPVDVQTAVVRAVGTVRIG